MSTLSDQVPTRDLEWDIKLISRRRLEEWTRPSTRFVARGPRKAKRRPTPPGPTQVAVAPFTLDAVVPRAADVLRAHPELAAALDHMLGADAGDAGAASTAPLAVFGSTADVVVPSASLAALFHRLPPASRGPLALFPGVSHRRLKDRHDLTATYAAFLNCHLRKDLGACAAVAAACAAADVCEMPPPTPVSTA